MSPRRWPAASSRNPRTFEEVPIGNVIRDVPHQFHAESRGRLWMIGACPSRDRRWIAPDRALSRCFALPAVCSWASKGTGDARSGTSTRRTGGRPMGVPGHRRKSTPVDGESLAKRSCREGHGIDRGCQGSLRGVEACRRGDQNHCLALAVRPENPAAIASTVRMHKP